MSAPDNPPGDPPTRHLRPPHHVDQDDIHLPEATSTVTVQPLLVADEDEIYSPTVIYGPTLQQLEEQLTQRGKIKDGELAVHLAAVQAFNDILGKVPPEYVRDPVTVDRKIIDWFATRLTSNAEWAKTYNDQHSKVVRKRDDQLREIARGLHEQHPDLDAGAIADLIVQDPEGQRLARRRVAREPRDDDSADEVTSGDVFKEGASRSMERETLIKIIRPVVAAK